jgi:hypothetical protein
MVWILVLLFAGLVFLAPQAVVGLAVIGLVLMMWFVIAYGSATSAAVAAGVIVLVLAGVLWFERWWRRPPAQR